MSIIEFKDTNETSTTKLVLLLPDIEYIFIPKITPTYIQILQNF